MKSKQLNKKLYKLNRATHRDIGYFVSALVIIYCLSGLALNHVNDWNPDFVVNKEVIDLPQDFDIKNYTVDDISQLSAIVGESKYKVIDQPTPNQLKIYYDNASLHLNTLTAKAEYEQITKRAVFYHANVLHRNSLKGWKWVSDIFAIVLILISITGLFILKGKNGFRGRGKWFVLGGTLLPFAAWLIFSMI